MKVGTAVQFNSDGEWTLAFVKGQGEGGPGNLDLWVKTTTGPGFELSTNVPEGTASGHWGSAPAL